MHQINRVGHLTHPRKRFPRQETAHAASGRCIRNDQQSNQSVKEHCPGKENITPLVLPTNFEPNNEGPNDQRP